MACSLHVLLYLLAPVVAATGSDVIRDLLQDVSRDASTPVPPLVATPAGAMLGSWMTSRRGRRFEAYRGIRYAEPPVGELRFQPPKPILHYPGQVNATVEGPACPQPADSADEYLVDEDCLRLNVYTHTTKCSELRPVVVYIHAGGFYSASGRSDEAGPHYLLDYELVFVALNYRLGSLGFLSTGDASAPGNNGLKDQVAALRWVRRNIASFCGDPELVTVTGYSAGAISVALHMISPMSKGLFHRARAMSGSPFTQAVTPNHQYYLAVRQARASGCPDHNSTVILDCLRKVPWRDLGNSLESMFEFGYDPILVWLPVIEADFGQERFLAEDPVLSVREGRMHAVPLMLSQTKDEFFWKAFNVLSNESLFAAMASDWERTASVAFLLPRGASGAAAAAAAALRRAYLGRRALLNDTRTSDGLGKLYGDSVIGFPVHRMAKLMAAHSSQPVFYYLFNYTGHRSFYEDPITKQPKGAAHHDDLIYLLSLRRVFPDVRPDGGRDARLLDVMCRIMYCFAKHGEPSCGRGGPAETRWPPVTPSARVYLSLGAQLLLRENLFEERFRVWEELFPLT